MKRLLALDLGTTTGWALRSETGAVESGRWSFTSPNGNPGRRWAWFLDRIEKVNPDTIVFERVVSGHRGARAAHIFGGFLAMLELLVHQRLTTSHPLELVEVGVSTLKKWATGKGNAKKDLMEQAARRRWPGIVVEDDNHADALLLLAYAVRGSGGPVPPEAPVAELPSPNPQQPEVEF